MIAGRFCPMRAFRERRCGGPVDWLLLALISFIIGYGAAAGFSLVCSLGGW